MILQTLLMIIAQRPDAEYNHEKVSELLKEASLKLHYQYFLREEILNSVGMSGKQGEVGLQVKFSNKFLPSTLPLTGELTDRLMRMAETGNVIP